MEEKGEPPDRDRRRAQDTIEGERTDRVRGEVQG